MGKIVVANWVTLDGVMQGPGSVDEDIRDGFAAGGWATPYADPVIGAKMGERMGAEFEWLFGRRTYEDLLPAWNARGGPFMDSLNGTRKYVASHDAGTTLRWPNSLLLHGDVPAAVAALKEQAANLVIMGSGVLIGALAEAGLVDEYLLTIAPVVLGRGRRLFDGGPPASLRLVDCAQTGTGALVVTLSCPKTSVTVPHQDIGDSLSGFGGDTSAPKLRWWLSTNPSILVSGWRSRSGPMTRPAGQSRRSAPSTAFPGSRSTHYASA